MNAKPKIVIVDYDCGNLFSIQRALQEVGVSSNISRIAQEIQEADKIILPGVGAFGDGMKSLQAHGLIDVILQCASSGKAILGICLGMQLLLKESFEFGHHPGLMLVPGKVTRLREDQPQGGSVKVPHIGWNAISFSDETYSLQGLLQGLSNGIYMYFLHSFSVTTEIAEHCVAMTEYGANRFCSIIQKKNIIGVQFHPELSGPSGLKLLQNFVFRL